MATSFHQRKAAAKLKRKFRTLCDGKIQPGLPLKWDEADAETIAGWFDDEVLVNQVSANFAHALLRPGLSTWMVCFLQRVAGWGYLCSD